MKKAKTKAPAREPTETPRSTTTPKTPAKKKVSPASAKRANAARGEVIRPGAETTTRGKVTLHLAEKPFATAQQPAPGSPPAEPPALTATPAVPAEPAWPGPARIPVRRADVPPEAGFTLQVDGHFKNQFETLTEAKQAASDLKSRFPILRIEIYDAAKKARLPI